MVRKKIIYAKTGLKKKNIIPAYPWIAFAYYKIKSKLEDWSRLKINNALLESDIQLLPCRGNWGHPERITEKAMAPHSSTLAWKIPWTEEPGGLQSMGSLRVEHNWASSLSLFTFMHWRRKWQPPPVFLPGESQGRGSLVGCCLWGRTESDTTEVTQQQQQK